MKKIAFLCLAIFALTAWPAAIQAQYLFWHYDKLIENNFFYDGYEPHIAVSGSKAVAVWQQSDSNGQRIYSCYSINGGKTWSADRVIDVSSTWPSYSPYVAMSGNNVVAVWKKYHLAGGGFAASYRVHASSSADGGKTWRPDQAIEDNAGYNAEYPRVAISGIKVVVAWFQPDVTNFRIYANSSSNAGQTWSTDQRLDATTGWDSEYPEVALSGSNAVVVWWRYTGTYVGIYSNSSQNGGATWRSERYLETSAGASAASPDVAVSGSRAIAVWNRQGSNGYSHIYSNYSLDGGQTWHSDQEAESYTLNHSYAPRVILSGTKAVIIWYRNESGSVYRVCSNTSTDGGINWGTPQFVNKVAALNTTQPRLAFSGTKVAAIWTENDGSASHITSNLSVNLGTTWRSDQRLDGVVGVNGTSPQIALSPKGAVAVWVQSDAVHNRIASNYAIYTAGQKYMLLPPILFSPAYGAPGLPTTVTLYWQDTNTSPQELKYRIRIKPAGGTYSNYLVPANATSFVKSGLAKGKTYFWNVQAVGNGTSIVNSSWANGGADWAFITLQ